MAPTEEEEAKLSNYKGDINELGSAEKLVIKMLTVPCAFQRIEAMLYRATFDDEVIHLRNSFQMLEVRLNCGPYNCFNEKLLYLFSIFLHRKPATN